MGALMGRMGALPPLGGRGGAGGLCVDEGPGKGGR